MSQGKPYTKEQKKKILESLEYYLKLAYSRSKACKFIGFDETTLSKWLSNDEALSMKIQCWENSINVKVRENIQKKIESGDVNQSNWWAERKMKKEFSTRQELTGEDGGELPILVKFLNVDENNRDTK